MFQMSFLVRFICISVFILVGFVGNLSATQNVLVIYSTPDKHEKVTTPLMTSKFNGQQESNPLNFMAVSGVEKVLTAQNYPRWKGFYENRTIGDFYRNSSMQTISNWLTNYGLTPIFSTANVHLNSLSSPATAFVVNPEQISFKHLYLNYDIAYIINIKFKQLGINTPRLNHHPMEYFNFGSIVALNIMEISLINTQTNKIEHSVNFDNEILLPKKLPRTYGGESKDKMSYKENLDMAIEYTENILNTNIEKFLETLTSSNTFITQVTSMESSKSPTRRQNGVPRRIKESNFSVDANIKRLITSTPALFEYDLSYRKCQIPDVHVVSSQPVFSVSRYTWGLENFNVINAGINMPTPTNEVLKLFFQLGKKSKGVWNKTWLIGFDWNTFETSTGSMMGVRGSYDFARQFDFTGFSLTPFIGVEGAYLRGEINNNQKQAYVFGFYYGLKFFNF